MYMQHCFFSRKDRIKWILMHAKRDNRLTKHISALDYTAIIIVQMRSYNAHFCSLLIHMLICMTMQ